MKRILAFIMLLISVFALAGCDLIGGGKDGSFKEVELSQEELQAEIDKIDLSLATENVVALTTELDVKLAIEMETPTSYDPETEEIITEKVEGSVELKGNAGIYANLKSFEEMFIFAEIDVTYKFDLEDMGEDLDFGLTEGFIKGKVYLTNGNAYLDVAFKEGGTEISIKNQIKDVVTEEDYDEMVGELDFEGSAFEIGDIFEELSYKVLQDKDKFKLEFDFIKTDLDELVDLLNDEMFEGEKVVKITRNEKFSANAFMIFSEVIEKVSLSADLDFDLRMAPMPGLSIDLSIYAKVKLTLDFNAKMPKVPSQSELDKFPEGLPNLPFLPSF